MRFLSVCSGIEAASVAWNPLGWKAAALAEIEPFPCSVLAHHYPDVPNWGDMTKFQEWPLVPIDLLCGGTPCQSFSVAGLRAGLDDPRGNLMLTFGSVARRYRPTWLVWENVFGVLSSDGGRAFGTFLGMLGQLGYGFAYRVLDAQYFGVPQRRPRVFVVGRLGNWRSAAAVLFERHSLRGADRPANPSPVSVCLTARGAGSLDDREAYIVEDQGPRHMTPLECERVQGFPDNYTLVPHRGKPAKDGPRYKAIGNSWPVPCARWIGERIQAVESISEQRQAA